MRTIVIDPGHGGGDSGAVGPTGLREADIVWDWAKACRWFLEIAGFTTAYTHTRDWGLWKRVKFPNRLRPGVANKHKAPLLCLHLNAATRRDADYTLVLHNGQAGAVDWAVTMSKQLATVTLNPQATVRRMQSADRGSGLILPVKEPALLLEACFISNPDREAWLRSHEHVVGLARAVQTACSIHIRGGD